MKYHGIILSTTYARHREGMRYAFVSDQHGMPIESIGRSRFEMLLRMSKGQDGWTIVGTFPAGRQPKDVWAPPVYKTSVAR